MQSLIFASPARRLGCYVLVGFPERRQESNALNKDTFYNSLMIVKPDGTLHTIYQKHFLYETDEAWSTPGRSFIALDLPFPRNLNQDNLLAETFRLVPCICMDLNPHQFTAPFEAYELGTFAAEERADVVICSMAWLDQTSAEEEAALLTSWDKIRATVTYWAGRLSPLLSSDVTFIACNRVGEEGDMIPNLRFFS